MKNDNPQPEVTQTDDVFKKKNDASDNVVILADESGTQERFELLDLISYRKKEYVVLLPVEEESEQVVILQIEAFGPDEEAYIGVENEYTLEAVFSLFKERHKDEFIFDDKPAVNEDNDESSEWVDIPVFRGMPGVDD